MTKIMKFAKLSLGVMAFTVLAHANLITLTPDPSLAALPAGSATSLVGSSLAMASAITGPASEFAATVSAFAAAGNPADVPTAQLDQLVSGSQPGAGTDSVNADGGTTTVPDAASTLRLIVLSVVGFVAMRLLISIDGRKKSENLAGIIVTNRPPKSDISDVYTTGARPLVASDPLRSAGRSHIATIDKPRRRWRCRPD
jgi:hypothetical protein